MACTQVVAGDTGELLGHPVEAKLSAFREPRACPEPSGPETAGTHKKDVAKNRKRQAVNWTAAPLLRVGHLDPH